MSENTTIETLAQHPRLAGILFTAALLTIQASNAAANAGAGNAGP